MPTKMQTAQLKTYARPGTFVTLQVLLLLTFLQWQVKKLMSRKPVALRDTVLLADNCTWPFHAVSVIFYVQFLVCASGSMLASAVKLCGRVPGFGQIPFLSRMQFVAVVIGFNALFAGMHYGRLGQGGEHRLGEGFGLFGREPRLADRYFMWALLAPLEWVPYLWLYTRATVTEVVQVMTQTALMCLLGAAAILDDDNSMEGESTTRGWSSLSFFIGGCLVFTILVKGVAGLEPEPIVASQRRRCFLYFVIMWTAYPVVHVLRSIGLLSAWAEQVLITSFFDAVAKCLLQVFCWTGPLYALWNDVVRALRDNRKPSTTNRHETVGPEEMESGDPRTKSVQADRRGGGFRGTKNSGKTASMLARSNADSQYRMLTSAQKLCHDSRSAKCLTIGAGRVVDFMRPLLEEVPWEAVQ
eukprot:TRINITY_DN36846_c0_g1_i1.p1 TRINITY_DN36846_c0_g1~~TRINITY_DN36846_c0_g1_i1.p1  ORF type:complete len:413 (+),score=54.52 TRINITY_DN36846_c0_g1_i1:71-1309(+)